MAGSGLVRVAVVIFLLYKNNRDGNPFQAPYALPSTEKSFTWESYDHRRLASIASR